MTETQFYSMKSHKIEIKIEALISACSGCCLEVLVAHHYINHLKLFQVVDSGVLPLPPSNSLSTLLKLINNKQISKWMNEWMNK